MKTQFHADVSTEIIRLPAIIVADEPNNPRSEPHWRGMLELAQARGNVVEALALVNDNIPQKWEEKLVASGFGICRSSGGDCDHTMVSKLVELHDRAEIFIIASGDHGFSKIALLLRRIGKRVIICASRASAHQSLLAAANEFVDMSVIFGRPVSTTSNGGARCATL